MLCIPISEGQKSVVDQVVEIGGGDSGATLRQVGFLLGLLGLPYSLLNGIPF